MWSARPSYGGGKGPALAVPGESKFREAMMTKFLAVYTGSASPDQKAAAEVDQDTIAAGIAAWGEWMERHAADIVEAGGPLGKTKKVSAGGVSDIRNNLTGYVIVQAESHEAAARMFEGHPHFTIFPGDGVEIMECLPIPGA
jgi:hypothetical protein